ncbi:MAG TPA: cadherin-like domain-containing protein, partial [Tenuifilaceae bacterium]|nr:cadherin-like domain-containing protein [Tenuifilaceae bacterium]
PATPLTFNAGNYNLAQTVTLTGVNDQIDDGDQPYTISLTASSSDTKYNNISIPSVSASNTDDDTAGVILSTISNNTTEAGGTATFTVRLNSQPTDVVTIASASNRTSEGTVISGNSLIFDNSNWETNQTVTVRGVQDLIDDGDQPYSIVLSATSGDGIYNGIAISSVSVINEDDDEVGLVISEASLSTSEPNGADGFTLKLNSQPTGNVTVAVSTTDATEGQVAPTNLSFTTSNWNTPQNVTVTGQDDDEVDGNIDYNISLKANSTVDTKYNNLAIVAVPATNDDDDVAEITVTPYAGLSTTEAGGTATFNIVLTSKPTSSVSVRLTSSNIAEGYVSAVSRGSLNIPGNEATVSFEPNEWNSQVTVTIKGVDDDIDDNNVAYTIVTETAVSSDGNYSIINPRDVSVINNDNDTYGTTVSPTTLSMDEDGTAQTATIVLRSRPTATVRFNITSSNTNRATVSPSYVEFLSTGDSWRTAQTLTVTPVDNFIADGNAEPNIVFAPGISTDNNYKNHVPSAIALTITDDDIADITVSSVTGFTTEAGGTATFTVVLTSEPTSLVTITMSSSNTDEGIITEVTLGRGTVGPGNTASITFDNTNWDEPVTITVQGVDEIIEDGSQTYQIDFLPTVSDDISYDEINLDPVEIVNQDDDKAGYTVYPVSGLVTTESGTTAQFNVFLNTQPTGNVVVDLASTDISEGLITNVTRGTWDEGANTANITFDETHWDVTEEVTITVTGIDDLTDDGDIPYSITLTANAASTEDPLYNILIPSVSLTNRDDLTPRPNIDNAITDQETPIVIDVLANDLGLDYGETVTVVTQPEHGTAIANADNTITYTPDRYYHGSYSFSYRVCNTISNCANSTVNVDVTWIDVTPIANDD